MPIENLLYKNGPNANPLKVLVYNNGICCEKFRSQDKDTFKLTYKRYSALIYGSILSAIADEEKAALILEQTFLKAWEAVHLFDESKCSLFTWLLRIAKIECLK